MIDGLPGPGPAGVLGYGLMTRPGLRQILAQAGYPLRPGIPRNGDWIAVWGQRPSARRGTWVARRCARHVLHIEEAFLAGVDPSRRHPPYGLLLDRLGIHYDGRRPSEVEHLLASAPLNDPALLTRAAQGRARLCALGLGKYLLHDPKTPALPDGHILVVDQLRGDASVKASGADRGTFLAMLEFARTQFPEHPLVVRAHPRATSRRPGHLSPADLRPGEHWDANTSAPRQAFDRCHRILTVSSGLGLDSLWAGQRPITFGLPIYAGWGLSEDRMTCPRRRRSLTVDQLFAALMILAPTWYDPFRDRLCAFEDILDIAEAEAPAAVQDRKGYRAYGMSLWKRPRVSRMFGGKVRYAGGAALGQPALVWGTAVSETSEAVRVEDGFLRSNGLGARLTPPMSLIADDLGIYYDPRQPSRLEALIAQSGSLPQQAHARAKRLVARAIETRATKYRQGGTCPDLPDGPVLLVPGQVADDASVRLGATGPVRDNAALLRATREANPAATILYKPHPDVEANLRPGAIAALEADLILRDTDPGWLLDQRIAGVWTLTSLMGFEALLRGIPVTCLGTPFYAGWGLTHDLAPTPVRRKGRSVALSGLAHAALIGAPRYFEAQSGRICPPEVALDAMTQGAARPFALGLAAKAQGILVTAGSWRQSQ